MSMYQEAVLEQVDAINDVVLESELDVLMSMAEMYIKESYMIQESEKPETVDVAPEDQKPTNEPVNNPAGNEKKANWVKRAVSAIIKFFKSLPKKFMALIGKIKKKFSRLFTIIRNKDQKEAAKAWKAAGGKVAYDDDGKIVYLVPDGLDIPAIKKACDAMNKWLDTLLSNDTTAVQAYMNAFKAGKVFYNWKRAWTKRVPWNPFSDGDGLESTLNEIAGKIDQVGVIAESHDSDAAMRLYNSMLEMVNDATHTLSAVTSTAQATYDAINKKFVASTGGKANTDDGMYEPEE